MCSSGDKSLCLRLQMTRFCTRQADAAANDDDRNHIISYIYIYIKWMREEREVNERTYDDEEVG